MWTTKHPLRGHRDNATDMEKDVQQLENHGNFHALLKFRVQSGFMGHDPWSTSSRRSSKCNIHFLCDPESDY